MRSIHVMFLLLASTLAARADGREDSSPSRLSPKNVAAGWILLFDGTTSFGWETTGDVSARDGALILRGEAASQAQLTSVFGAAELHVRWQGSGQLDALAKGSGSQAGLGLSSTDGQAELQLRIEPDPSFNGLELNALGSGKSTKAHLRYGGAQPILKFSNVAGKELRLQDIRLKPTGLQSIFNGKDLTGWKEVKTDRTKSIFSVTEKGEMNVKDGPGDLQTEGEWDDFVLQLDIISAGDHLNSGVFYRCQPGQFWSGYEAQVRNEWVSDVVTKNGEKFTGSLTPRGDELRLDVCTVANGQGRFPRKREVKTLNKADVEQVIDHRDIPIDFGTGGVYNRQPARKVVSSDREWFTMTVAAHGNHMAVWVNGYQTADFTDTRPANASARQGNKVDKGPISLQGHDPTTNLSFRNIRVAGLRASPK